MTWLWGRSSARSHRRAYLRGAASVMNLRGTTQHQYPMYPTPAEADAAALASDWRAVGDDMRDVMPAMERRISAQ